MPELPEVETVVRDLRPLLVGKRLASIHASKQQLRKKWSKAWDRGLVGSRVTSIRRRGKWILVDLDSGGLFVLHLGMTGQLIVVSQAAEIEKHTHLTIPLDDGAKELRFRDVRRFGSAALYADEGAWTESLDRRLGPEPFDMAPRYWRESLSKTTRSIKAVLLDQSVVAGIGNIYADESLFRAKIHPTQTGSRTTSSQAERLRKAIVEVLNDAIGDRGSTIRDYVGGTGLRGGYQDEFRVYGRTGKPCLKCRTPIECIRLAGRSAHYCPRCQKVGSGRLAVGSQQEQK